MDFLQMSRLNANASAKREDVDVQMLWAAYEEDTIFSILRSDPDKLDMIYDYIEMNKLDAADMVRLGCIFMNWKTQLQENSKIRNTSLL